MIGSINTNVVNNILNIWGFIEGRNKTTPLRGITKVGGSLRCQGEIGEGGGGGQGTCSLLSLPNRFK